MAKDRARCDVTMDDREEEGLPVAAEVALILRPSLSRRCGAFLHALLTRLACKIKKNMFYEVKC